MDKKRRRRKKKQQKTFNPVSPVVLVLVAVMVLVELVLQAGERGWIGGPTAMGWRLELVRDIGFHKAVFDHILMGGDIEPKVIWPFLSYMFVHKSFLNMLINAALILAMGKMIADKFSGPAVLAIFIACGLAGALTFGVFSTPGGFPMAGAHPVFYGFIGTYTWIRISELRAEGKNIMPAFAAVGMFLVFRSLAMLKYGPSNSWMADLAGLFAGFLVAVIVAPDGKDRIKGWIKAARDR